VAGKEDNRSKNFGTMTRRGSNTSQLRLNPETRAGVIVQEQPKASWKSYIWDTLNKSPEERQFLFKLDIVLMSFASLGYFIKYLDQVNINSAFVSGMKEDFGLYGNELNYLIAAWTVGYVLGQIPRYFDIPILSIRGIS
jgi:MFS transporter, ACS family, pantothenate transporter